jgi:hypothetical protein
MRRFSNVLGMRLTCRAALEALVGVYLAAIEFEVACPCVRNVVLLVFTAEAVFYGAQLQRTER